MFLCFFYFFFVGDGVGFNSLGFLLRYCGFTFLRFRSTGSFYTTVTNFMQGYIDSEANFNADNHCTGTCHNYISARNYNCQNGTLCGHSNFQKTTCSGDIFDCDTLQTNGVACLTVILYLKHDAKVGFQCKMHINGNWNFLHGKAIRITTNSSIFMADR